MLENKVQEEKVLYSLKEYYLFNYKTALDIIEEIINDAVRENDKPTLAVSLSLKALYLYFNKTESFISVMQLAENAKFLAEIIDNISIKDIVYYVYSQILLEEKDYVSAQEYFSLIKNVQNSPLDIEGLSSKINSKLKDGNKIINSVTPLFNIAKTISPKTDIDSLLKTIADETTCSLNAERCSVFLLDRENAQLWSKVATGIDFEEIRFPMDKGLAGHVAMSGDMVNITDAYSDERFNKEIDIQTGYHTRNILCMPIRNMHYEIIGVLQVLNKIGGCFNEDDEKLLVTICMNAGISIENSKLFEKQQQLFEDQKQLFASFIDTLVASIDARDKITSGHSNRVKMYASLICNQLNLDSKITDLIEQAAILHDIGKIGIKDSILQKEGNLSVDESLHIHEHAKITYDILSKIYNTEETKQIAEIAASHHEKYDGTGYYKRLKGEEIPFGGRILAVADVFDAITSKRHYRDKMQIKNVISILIEDSNTHFDPYITDVFLKISCDKIVGVFLNDLNINISDEDKEILSNFKMKELYDILNKDVGLLTEDEVNMVTVFDKYYKN